MATVTKEMSLKLLVDGKSKKVVYAEAKKDCIDFLFGILQLPIGSIMTLLVKNGLELEAAGSMGRMIRSVSDMGNSHFHSSGIKDALLKPVAFSGKGYSGFNPPLLLKEFASWERVVTYDAHGPTTAVEGYITADNCSYMVMDDLVVVPTSVVALLKKFKIKDLDLLVEKIVKIDLKNGLKLVKASMESDTVLTDVFID